MARPRAIFRPLAYGPAMEEDVLAAAEAELPDELDYGSELRGEGFDWGQAARHLLDQADELLSHVAPDTGAGRLSIEELYRHAFEATELHHLLARTIASLHQQL